MPVAGMHPKLLPLWLFGFHVFDGLVSQWLALGVGSNKPYTVALMGRSSVGC